ncbi:MAG: hypothetical protein M3018_05195 [Actinomycetota bacterium]|nr:hypothetical protein [Actinomycetota bacterium]
MIDGVLPNPGGYQLLAGDEAALPTRDLGSPVVERTTDGEKDVHREQFDEADVIFPA